VFFVIDNLRLQQFIRLTRNDGKSRKRHEVPWRFFRIEANGNAVRLRSSSVESELPATVYEPGVLYIRVDLLARTLATMADEPTLAIQANREGLHIANVRFSLEFGEMLLYADPERAPLRHPEETRRRLPRFDGQDGPASWGPLFGVSGLKPYPPSDRRKR
jgi:hypothetical protein